MSFKVGLDEGHFRRLASAWSKEGETEASEKASILADMAELGLEILPAESWADAARRVARERAKRR